jgi:BMFP domain-containing protein YqiC
VANPERPDRATAAASTTPVDETGELAAPRLARQGLGRQLPDILSATQHLVAVQAQSWQGALLTLANRVERISTRDVEVLVDSGDLIVSWINRGTLHLVHRDDFDWLHALVAPAKANALRARLSRLGVEQAEADELVNDIVQFVTEHGITTKDEMSLHLKGRGLELDALTTAQLLEVTAQRRLLVRGPIRAGSATYVLADSWVGTAPELPDHAELMRQLVRRYCASHWPAAPADLAAWAGLPL